MRVRSATRPGTRRTPTVALVAGDKLHFVDVAVGLNDGMVVQLRFGVRAGDRVAINVPSELDEGTPIEAVAPPPSTPAPGPSAIGGGPR